MKISVLTPSIRPEGLAIVQKCLAEQTEQDFEWLVELGIPEKGYDLNRAMNRMLRRARGELVVFYQDWIRIHPDGLQKFWEAYQANPRTAFTAPVGKTDNRDFPNWTGRWDWRVHMEGEIPWQRWEIDWGSAPLAGLREVGGWDEAIDVAWSCDNVNVACRLDLAGWKFRNIKGNTSVAWDHNHAIPHPFAHTYDPSKNNARMDEFRRGLKLDNLTVK